MLVDSFTPEPGVEYIKIHGLQRSGTNYLAGLVDDNFQNVRSLSNVGGWKHGHYCAPWVIGFEVHVLIVTKNPYAWLDSLYRYWSCSDVGEDLTGKTFEQFVTGKAVFERAAGTPYLLHAANPVRHWNDMNFHWLSVRANTKKVLAVPYEALLVDTDGVLGAVADDFGLKRGPLAIRTEKATPSGKGGTWVDRDYYLKELFLHKYTPELIRFVNDNLDADVMGTLGYSFVKEDR